MANQNAVSQRIHIQGDGVSLTATVNLKTTPIVQFNCATLNYNPTPDAVAVTSAWDSLGNHIEVEVSISKNGSALLYTFSAPFTDKREINIDLLYNI